MNGALLFSSRPFSAGRCCCCCSKCRRKHRDTTRDHARLRPPDVRATLPPNGWTGPVTLDSHHASKSMWTPGPAQSKSQPHPIRHHWGERELWARSSRPPSVLVLTHSCGWIGANPWSQVPKPWLKPGEWRPKVSVPHAQPFHMAAVFRCPNTFGYVVL